MQIFYSNGLQQKKKEIAEEYKSHHNWDEQMLFNFLVINNWFGRHKTSQGSNLHPHKLIEIKYQNTLKQKKNSFTAIMASITRKISSIYV